MQQPKTRHVWPRLREWFLNHPKWAATIAGVVASFAMAPFGIWPVLAVSLGILLAVMDRIERPFRGAWTVFFFSMGYFTVSLWWVSNALLMDLEVYWWAMGFAILGLPLLLSICWFVAGWLTIRFSKPGTLSRMVLLLTLIALAEYGRAFNLTGFPWNLFGYTWYNAAPIMQLSAIGGAYLVTVLTMFWMATPTLAWKARANRRLRAGIIAVAVVTFLATALWGQMRLAANPTEYREDTAFLIVQPDIRPADKWETDKVMEHFMRHVDLTSSGLATLKDAPASLKDVVVVWPETALEERLVMTVPEAPKALLDVMQGHPYTVSLVSGLWREEPADPATGRPAYFNSIGAISVEDGKLNLDDVYDKHHLVPFGEFLPMEQTLGLTPLVGFAGFKWGPGPRTLQPASAPAVAPMICFEAIFPWYAGSPGAEWLVNTSNDGWYRDTPGPYQHLAMTRFRAVEQGKPIARSATTGISAVIDPYGRALHTLDYQRRGYLVSAMPKLIQGGTPYARLGEVPFFAALLLGLGAFVTLRKRHA